MFLRNDKSNKKLSDELYRLTNKKGCEVTVLSDDGVIYRRNSSQVKKYIQGGGLNARRDKSMSEETDTVNDEVIRDRTDNRLNRPKRERHPPERFDEQLLYK